MDILFALLMSPVRHPLVTLSISCFLIASHAEASASPLVAAPAKSIGKVFVIVMENRNFTQPASETFGQAILGSPHAPFINSLVTPGDPNAKQVSWASCYHHVLALPGGTTSENSIHPSEPNYLWLEGGSNFGVKNDSEPYGPKGNVQAIADYLAAHPELTGKTLRTLLNEAGIPWCSYQENTGMEDAEGNNANATHGKGGIVNRLVPAGSRSVPYSSFSGTSPNYTNPYNGTHQYSFGAKHEGALFFPATNGGTLAEKDKSPSNPMAKNYAPLQQLESDLAAGTCARYNFITPDLANDMHNVLLAGTFTYRGHTYGGNEADSSQVAQGDNFLSLLIPRIMASPDYKNNGAIFITTDESEGKNPNDFRHTILGIVISPLARGNAYESRLNYTHSSTLNTMQKIFQVAADSQTGYINDAANPSNGSGENAGSGPGFGTGTAYDLGDLFVDGAIPKSIPSPKKNPK